MKIWYKRLTEKGYANPDNMLKKDPIAKALLKEYNNAIMLNQNLSDDDTRAVAEYLRTL